MVAQAGRERSAMAGRQSARDAELAFLALLLRRLPGKSAAEAVLSRRERENFYRAVRNYYRADREEFRRIVESVTSPEELAAIFHLARHAGLETPEVLRLRQQGIGWAALARLLHLGRESFYVPLGRPTAVTPGAPFGNFREEARLAWSSTDFTDLDILNLVNLKFVSEYYRCQPEHVIALRATGWSFAAIHALFREVRSDAPARPRAGKPRPSQR